jgi:hypothetical protein
MTLFFRVIATGACVCALGAQAHAQDPYARCADITDNAERLDCYDALARPNADAPSDEPTRLADDIAAAETIDAPPAPDPAIAASEATAPSEDFVVLPRAEAEQLRRKARAADENERREKREPYESEIVRVFTTGYGVINVALENGEVWRQLQKTGGRKPRVGDRARLAPASLGSWTVRYGSSGAKVKVKRVR